MAQPLAWCICLLAVSMTMANSISLPSSCSDANCLADGTRNDDSDGIMLLQKKMRAITHSTGHYLRNTEHAVGPFVVKLEQSSRLEFALRVVHSSDSTHALFTGITRGSDQQMLSVGSGVFDVLSSEGCFIINSTTTFATAGQSLDSILQQTPYDVSFSGKLFASDGTPISSYVLSFVWSSSNPLLLEANFQLKDMAQPLDRYFLTSTIGNGEKIYGFGEQYTVGDLRGRIVQVMNQEQGVGRGAQPLSTYEDLKPPHCFGGSWETTYTDIPYYLTSEARGLLVNTTAFSKFDVGATKADAITALVMMPGLNSGSFLILSGQGPNPLLGVIEALTSRTGRMAPLPRWISGEGALVGIIGGTRRVNNTWTVLKAFGIPLASLWIQDWSGEFDDSYGVRTSWNWMVDPTLYPDWNELLGQMEQDGVKATVYNNPYISYNHPAAVPSLWTEAASLGYFVKNLSGQPFIMSSGSAALTFSIVDLTNPEAWNWYKLKIRCNVLGDQAACPPNITTTAKTWGFMSDFGEYLPYLKSEVVLFSGEDPAIAHGRWPSMWQQLCREAVIDAGREGEAIFWTRSASLPYTAHTTAMWMGDQTTTWDNHDGMQSAFTGMMNGGLSGLGISHSDVGGIYMLVANKTKHTPNIAIWRTPQILKRWAEMSAFADSIFRTHPGCNSLAHTPGNIYGGPTNVVELWNDIHLLENFRRNALIHKTLWPYRLQLMQEHYATGAPLVRNMFLHFYDDPECWHLPFQYMLGSEMLVAPSFVANATTTAAYLPSSREWVHMWSGSTFSSGWHNVSTPMGFPAVFVTSPMSALMQAVVNELRQIQ